MNYPSLWIIVEKYEKEIGDAVKEGNQQKYLILMVALGKLKQEFGIGETKQ